MAIPQNINCPNCGQPFQAIIEQIIDVGRDPSAKERLLSGRVNQISCPHCSYRGAIGTPLMYHDPEKELAIVFVPMELDIEQAQREKMIGDMTRAVMQSLPEDAPKGYLLQPGTALTFQGLIEQVMEAEGISREMLDAERRKIELIDDLIDASSMDEAEQLIAENEELIDRTFLELLRATGQSLGQQEGMNRQSLRLLNLRSKLMETTEAGQALKKQEEAMVEASQELQAMGEEITREKFVNLLINAVDNQPKFDALASLGRMLLDYQTFQLFSSHIENAESEERKEQLKAARERMREIAEAYEQQSRAVVERAVDTLRTLLQADDLRAAIAANLERIDDTFLSVLQANIQEAQRQGQVDASARLKAIRDEVLRIVQESAPPEIQLINEMLSAETAEQSIQILKERQNEITPDIIAVMEDLSQQLRMAGNEPVAERIDMLQVEAQKLI